MYSKYIFVGDKIIKEKIIALCHINEVWVRNFHDWPILPKWFHFEVPRFLNVLWRLVQPNQCLDWNISKFAINQTFKKVRFVPQSITTQKIVFQVERTDFHKCCQRDFLLHKKVMCNSTDEEMHHQSNQHDKCSVRNLSSLSRIIWADNLAKTDFLWQAQNFVTTQ